MTISSEVRKAGPYTGNGTTTEFAFTFRVFEQDDVKVILTNSAGAETVLVLNSDYYVTLNDEQETNNGGTIEYPRHDADPMPAKLSSTQKLTILSNIEYTQELDLTNGGGFYPDVIEASLDKMTMQIQQLKEVTDRAVIVEVSSGIDPDNYLSEVNTSKAAAAASAAAALVSETNAAASEASAAASANVITTNLTNINKVAAIDDEIVLVAAIDDEVADVSLNMDAIKIVSSDLGGAGFDYDLGSITDPATGPSNAPDGFIVTVAENIADVSTVAGIDAEVSAVAGNTTNINAVAGNATNINAVAGNATNINLVANDKTNIDAVAGDLTNIDAVAGDLTDINAVAADATDIGLVAGSIANVNIVAANVADIDIVVANITDIQNAEENADAAAASAILANDWATKTSGPVAGGEYSAKYHAGLASTSASSAASAQSAAESARDATLAAYDSFDDRYLGAKTGDPSVDNDGNALVAGSLYYRSTSPVGMKVYTGSVWVDSYADGNTFLSKANNLSDLQSASSARSNLGLGSAATTDSSAYATAAQGANADTAYGWGNHASAGYLTSLGIGTSTQAYDAGLTALAAIANMSGSDLEIDFGSIV